MTGLGIGIIYETRLHASGAPVLLGLGLGFLGIYVIGSLRGRTAGDRWPIIPGGILTAAALLIAANQTGILGAVGRWWPLVLIAVGVYVILRPRQGRTS